MNLKEAFRYQSFLDKQIQAAGMSIASRDHALKTTEIHRCSLMNPETVDHTEQVDRGDFFPNDDVIRFGVELIAEKRKLTQAIAAAKASVGMNIDAEIETNKFRRSFSDSIRLMLKVKPGKKKTLATGYRFDVNQVQIPYYYDMESVDEDNFDREQARIFARRLTEESDRVSSDVEAALVNTVVAYDPPFDVNDSFEDVMREFLSR